MTIESEKFNKDVQLSISSGVKPIEFRFFPIVDFEDGKPFAYRAEVVIHSIITGVMDEKYYTHVSDVRKCGISLFKHVVSRLIYVIKQFKSHGKEIKFISVRCPSELVEEIDFYNTLKEILSEHDNVDKDKICLEFPASLIAKDEEKATTAILDVKALGIKTAIRNCGEKDFAVMKLTKITPDILYIDPSVTSWVDDRNKPHLFTSFVNFVKFISPEVIIEAEDKYKKLVKGSECEGFISLSGESLSLEEVLNQKDDEIV